MWDMWNRAFLHWIYLHTASNSYTFELQIELWVAQSIKRYCVSLNVVGCIQRPICQSENGDYPVWGDAVCRINTLSYHRYKVPIARMHGAGEPKLCGNRDKAYFKAGRSHKVRYLSPPLAAGKNVTFRLKNEMFPHKKEPTWVTSLYGTTSIQSEVLLKFIKRHRFDTD